MQFMAHVATALISHMQLVRFLIIFHFNLNTCWRQKYVAVRDLWETSSTVLAGKRKYCWILQKYVKSCGSFSSLLSTSINSEYFIFSFRTKLIYQGNWICENLWILSVTSFSNVFLTGGARRHDFKSQALKRKKLDLHGCRFCARQGFVLGWGETGSYWKGKQGQRTREHLILKADYSFKE